MLNRVDVVKLVSDVLAKHMAGNAMLPMVLQLVDQIVRQNEAGAKKKLYALAMSYVFSVELGPLVTALLRELGKEPRHRDGCCVRLAQALGAEHDLVLLVVAADRGDL